MLCLIYLAAVTTEQIHLIDRVGISGLKLFYTCLFTYILFRKERLKSFTHLPYLVVPRPVRRQTMCSFCRTRHFSNQKVASTFRCVLYLFPITPRHYHVSNKKTLWRVVLDTENLVQTHSINK